MKKIAFFALSFCIASVILYLLVSPKKEMIYIHYLQRPLVPVASSETDVILEKINLENSKIKSFSCSDIEISIDNLPFRLQSFLIYKKNLNFRMIVQSFVGKELDMGSNKNHFWFWSKRMKPPGLYYAEHKDLYKTRLRTPFSPQWIIESLGFEEIKKAKISKSGKHLIIEENYLNAMNANIIKKTLVNIESRTIIGHYLYEGDVLVASSETIEYTNNMPHKIRIIWHEENIGMTLKLKNSNINGNFNDSYWSMPNYRNKINMAND
jgi:hypothetical protein